MRCFASCSFGLEAVVADELKKLGFEPTARDARVYFDADPAGIARANLWLSAADRVYLVVQEFFADTFDALFEGVKAIPWHNFLSVKSRFPIAGDSVHSVLKSVPDIQSIGKKAIVESLKEHYHLSFFKESDEEKNIYISILKDTVTVCINTSGAGLNRRGYRVKNVPAPLRENLASGLISLTRWYDRSFYDIMCGGGTIAIEAALKAKKQAPGLLRSFAAENWSTEYKSVFFLEKEDARSKVLKDPDVPIFASDIDEKVLDIARFHARRAGVLSNIHFSLADARDFSPSTEQGTIISNPPYALRLSQADEAHALYAELGARLSHFDQFKYYFICADQNFERYFGKNADKKRKLYNGNVKCNYYQYFRNK